MSHSRFQCRLKNMKWLERINEQYILRTLEVLVGLTLITPLITSSAFYFPFITPRNFFFRIIVSIMILLYTVLIVKNPQYLPRKHIVWKFLLIFTGLMTLSSIFGGNFLYSFWSNYERMDGLITLYYLVAFFFVLYGSFVDQIS